MVSRRSKGCLTCIRRKVKCDQRHPYCDRCFRAGFRCAGYEEIRFIDEEPKIVNRLRQIRETKAISHLCPLRETHDGRLGMPQLSTNHEAYHWLDHSSIGSSPTFTPWREDIYLAYASANLMAESDLNMFEGRIASLPSKQRIPELVVSRHCLLTLATIYFGSRHDSHEILQEGMKLYGISLKLVTQVLKNPSPNHQMEIMGAVAALSMCECLVPMDGFAWARHMMGLESLLASYESKNEVDATFLEVVRPIMITAAHFVRRPSLMATSQWKAEPIVNNDFSNISHYAYLMDVFAECSGLFSERDHLLSPDNSEVKISQMVATLEKTFTLLDQVRKWRTQWLEIHNDEIYETSPSVTICSVESPNWTRVLHYKSADTADINMLYHSIFILLIQILQPFQKLYEDQSSIWPKPDILGRSACQFLTSNTHDWKQNSKRAAIEICRSVDFYMHHGLDNSRRFALLCPLRIAWRRLRENKSKEGRWIEDVFHRIHKIIGPGIWSDIESTRRLIPNGWDILRLDYD